MSATPPLDEPFRQIRLSQIWQDLLSPVDALVAYSEILRAEPDTALAAGLRAHR